MNGLDAIQFSFEILKIVQIDSNCVHITNFLFWSYFFFYLLFSHFNVYIRIFVIRRYYFDNENLRHSYISHFAYTLDAAASVNVCEIRARPFLKDGVKWNEWSEAKSNNADSYTNLLEYMAAAAIRIAHAYIGDFIEMKEQPNRKWRSKMNKTDEKKKKKKTKVIRRYSNFIIGNYDLLANDFRNKFE